MYDKITELHYNYNNKVRKSIVITSYIYILLFILGSHDMMVDP